MVFRFGRKTRLQILAFVDGLSMNIENVEDTVFSSKMMGDGFAIMPASDVICSPVDGVIEMVFPTKHALGIKTKCGMEILIHIGIDTVNLGGDGFVLHVKEKQRVNSRTPLVTIERKRLSSLGYDLTTICIVTVGDIAIPKLGYDVHCGDVMIDI